jgi:hypothetical protein
MSENALQKALIHLVSNADRYRSYSDADFEEFELSSHEKQSLEELMTVQRAGLLVFHEQLRHKRRRAINDALPKSRAIAGGQLTTALNTHMSRTAHAGGCDPAEAVRCFADDVGVQIACRSAVSRELEFIRFEAVCASAALVSSATSPSRPARTSPGLRLSLRGDAALVSSTYDVSAAIEEPFLRPLSEYPAMAGLFFLFQAPEGKLRILAVASGLGKVLAAFLAGFSLDEVVRALEPKVDRTAAVASVERLLTLGAPFYAAS